MKCYGTFKTILKSNNKTLKVNAIPQWLLLKHQLWHYLGEQTYRAEHLSKQLLPSNKRRDGSESELLIKGLARIRYYEQMLVSSMALWECVVT